VEGRPAPPVEIVDLRELHSKKRSPPEEGGGVLSARLVSAVRDRIAKSEQIILLLNRRGYASFVQCRECGEVIECPNCSVSLTFHRGSGHLRCHHCRHEEEAPAKCSGCGADELSYRGLGTEQVERVVIETFPGARIARMDVDTTSGRWSHQEILDRVERGEVDLLLGTQMIAKGLDFPRVTLVGVVNADVGIHLPDFRASERAFQLLSQVAGRAGRGPLGGEVIIQSSLPDHYVLRSVLAHDVHGFVEREMEERKNPPYPPHLRLVNVVLSSPDPALAAEGAEAAAKWIRKELKRRGGEGSAGGVGREGSGPTAVGGRRADLGGAGIGLVGPAPSPIERLHRRWRWHFFLRGGGVKETTHLLRKFLNDFQPPAGDLRIAVDRDPVALL
jgi:primosomal protein N' (replication factor Y)